MAPIYALGQQLWQWYLWLCRCRYSSGIGIGDRNHQMWFHTLCILLTTLSVTWPSMASGRRIFPSFSFISCRVLNHSRIWRNRLPWRILAFQYERSQSGIINNLVIFDRFKLDSQRAGIHLSQDRHWLPLLLYNPFGSNWLGISALGVQGNVTAFLHYENLEATTLCSVKRSWE